MNWGILKRKKYTFKHSLIKIELNNVPDPHGSFLPLHKNFLLE